MNTLLNKLTNVEVFLTLIFILSVVGLIFPYGFPLFGPVVCLFFILFLLKGRLKIKLNIGILVLFICVLQYIWGVLLNNGVIYKHNLSDLTNIISFIMLILIFGNLNDESYEYFIKYIKRYGVFIISIFALIGLYKFVLMLNNKFIKFFFAESNCYPNGTSLMNDYNMFAFGILTVLFFSISAFMEEKRVGARIYYLCTTTILLLTAIFTGSRRAWVALGIIFILFSFYLIIVTLRKLCRFLLRFRLKITVKNLIFAVVAVVILLNTPLLIDTVSQEYKDSRYIQSMQYRFQTLGKEHITESFNPRKIRWEYGIRLAGEGNLWQAVFGQGFTYLPKYANEFGGLSKEDYPHNPFISGLLYAGVLGAFLLVFLLIIPLYYLLKYFDTYGWEFLAIYFVSLLFSLISSNSIFSNQLSILIIVIIFSVKPNRNYYLS